MATNQRIVMIVFLGVGLHIATRKDDSRTSPSTIRICITHVYTSLPMSLGYNS